MYDYVQKKKQTGTTKGPLSSGVPQGCLHNPFTFKAEGTVSYNWPTVEEINSLAKQSRQSER